MHNIINKIIVLLLLCSMRVSEAQVPQHPESYICYKTNHLIHIDGLLNESEWQAASWSTPFVDIEGIKKGKPMYSTQVKMLWDTNYFYVAARIFEPHIWATFRQRDTVIFYDNDFEIFIDPNGDNHLYYELEINALNTVWDLLLTKPYQSGGIPINSWDIQGLKSAVKIYGTLNNGNDKDSMWVVEIAMPWKVLQECAKHKGHPYNEEVWRVNFSRVNWQVEWKNGKYFKKINVKTHKPFPEYNWVWSAQGNIAMHQPETWGYVQFMDTNVMQSHHAIAYYDMDFAHKIKLVDVYNHIYPVFSQQDTITLHDMRATLFKQDIRLKFSDVHFLLETKGHSGAFLKLTNEKQFLY